MKIMNLITKLQKIEASLLLVNDEHWIDDYTQVIFEDDDSTNLTFCVVDVRDGSYLLQTVDQLLERVTEIVF